MTAPSTSAQVTPGRIAPKAACCEATVWSKSRRISSGRRADDHRPLELRVVAPDRRARLRHEHVAGPELDRVRDRVRPRAAQPDLAAIAGRRARRRREPADVAERREHRERRLVTRPEARLGLGRAGPRVLLQQPVRVRAPAPALADERDLGGALPPHHPLDHVAERRDRCGRRVAQRRPLVAEDAGVPVLVGADRIPDPQVDQDPHEDRHRVLDSRVLRIRLDPREVGLGARALDLELRHEHRRLAADALRVDHRPLVRQEPEPGEVLDGVGAEEDVAGQAVATDVLEQPFAPLLQLCSGDAHPAAYSMQRDRADRPAARDRRRGPPGSRRDGRLPAQGARARVLGRRRRRRVA